MTREKKLFNTELKISDWIEKLKEYILSKKNSVLEFEGITGEKELSILLNTRYFYDKYISPYLVKDQIRDKKIKKLPPSGRNKTVKLIAVKIDGKGETE